MAAAVKSWNEFGTCLVFLVIGCWLKQRAKTSRGAGCVLYSTRPPAVENGRALRRRGDRGEVWSAELFTMGVIGGNHAQSLVF